LLALSCSSPTVGRPSPQEVRIVSKEKGSCPLCEVFRKAQGWVVRVGTENGLGAAVIVSSSGLVATNAHVVRQADEVRLEAFDGNRFPGRVVLVNQEQDLALIQMATKGQFWPAPVFRSGLLPPIGSDVFVIGHPLGLGWSLTRGIISGYRRTAAPARLWMIQTDAAISPGNSGGPLLDRNGILVGIMTSKAMGGGAENLAFARPTSALLDLLQQAGGDSSPGSP